MNTIDNEEFRQHLVDGDNKAWNQLAAAIKSKFHCSDFEGHGEEDFVQEALIKFSACLAAGKIEPNVPIIPYILVIARNKQISAVRKESRRAKLVSNSPQEVGERIGQTDKSEHQSPKVSIDALSAQEQLAIAINGFRKDGFGESFKFIQAMILDTDTLCRVWDDCESKRTAQDRRKKILARGMNHLMSYTQNQNS